jgi:hypothetical protein
VSDFYIVDEFKDKVFDVKVGYFYEDIHPKDLFDNSINPDTNKPYYDTDEMAKRIDEHQDAWFGFVCKYFYRDHEIGNANLGGLYYKNESAESIILKQQKTNEDSWYADVVDEAKSQALDECRDIYNQLEFDFNFKKEALNG